MRTVALKVRKKTQQMWADEWLYNSQAHTHNLGKFKHNTFFSIMIHNLWKYSKLEEDLDLVSIFTSQRFPQIVQGKFQ